MSYNAMEFPARYHTLTTGGETTIGQRKPKEHMASIPEKRRPKPGLVHTQLETRMKTQTKDRPDTKNMHPVASADPIRATGVAVVAGAVGKIGTSTVRQFVSRGYFVIAVDNNPEKLEKLAEHQKGWVMVAPIDWRNQKTANDISKVLKEVGQLRHVVAITEETQNTQQPKIEDLQNSIKTNVTSTLTLLEGCIKTLQKTYGNRSITLCPQKNQAAGTLDLMETLTTILEKEEIRVNTVIAEPTTNSQQSHSKTEKPSHGRQTTEIEVATTIVSLATDLTAISNQTIRVDARHTRNTP